MNLRYARCNAQLALSRFLTFLAQLVLALNWDDTCTALHRTQWVQCRCAAIRLLTLAVRVIPGKLYDELRAAPPVVSVLDVQLLHGRRLVIGWLNGVWIAHVGRGTRAQAIAAGVRRDQLASD